jgi:SPP1 family phage portal protein
MGSPDGTATFVQAAIREHLQSEAYSIASNAELYYSKRNPTITKYQKFLYSANGKAQPDLYSANYKTKSLFFRKLVTQQASYVLSNGITFSKPKTEKQLGTDFDQRIMEAARKALVDGVAFLFWNNDHVEVFGYCDTSISPGFAPLFDAETNKLRAGIRYWTSGSGSEQRTTAVLYDELGYTKFRSDSNGHMELVEEQRPYLTSRHVLGNGMVDSVDYGSYPGFPIIPVYANDLKESELVGLRESIDCYDFIKNGLANDIDDSAGLYWTIQNSGGFDDVDFAKFLDRMRTVKAATVEDSDAEIQAHTLEIPTADRKVMLDQLEHDIYRDAMLLNVDNISAGNITATAIRAAYQAQDDKCGHFEACITDAILQLLALIGVEDYPKYKWNRIANQTEETNMVMTASTVLGDRLTLEKLPFLTPEEVEERLKEIAGEDLTRLTRGNQSIPDEPEEDEQEAVEDGNIND